MFSVESGANFRGELLESVRLLQEVGVEIENFVIEDGLSSITRDEQ